MRPERATVYDNGHADTWAFEGEIRDLTAKIIHDDRKQADRWLMSQVRYMILERDHLMAKEVADPRFSDRLRKVPLLMPVFSFFYCLFYKGLILDGRFGLHYALQRLVAESILSFMFLDESCRRRAKRERRN